MRIERTRPASTPGPAEWFTGEVWLDEIAVCAPPSRLHAHSVHFAPGARTAWHRHPVGQVLYVTEGMGRIQREDGTVTEIRAGDTVHVEPGETHWHGAAPNRFMTHLAIQETDAQGGTADWFEQVTDADYDPEGN